MSDTLEAMSPHTSRRTPRQMRSRSRVDAILQAAENLIHEKGFGNLKIHELAERAGVTPSSIYQYFPNKNAIMLALNNAYIEKTYDLMRFHFRNIDGFEGFVEGIENAIDAYYEWYKSIPAITDVIYGLSATKESQAAELTSSRQSAMIVVEEMKPFVSEDKQEELATFAMLLSHLAGATVRLCIMTDEQEALRLKDSFKKLLRNSAEMLVEPEPV